MDGGRGCGHFRWPPYCRRNEALLLAANIHFGWAEYGSWPNGQVADAWFEHLYLHRERVTLRAPLVRVIRDLRQTHEPDHGKLRRDHGYFEHLATCFPTLTPIIADMRMLERWRRLAGPLGNARDVSWVPPSDEENEALPWTIIRAVLIVITFLVWMSLYR